MHELELSVRELDLQRAELLPSRETLAFINVASIHAVNQALALNVASFKSIAVAKANQGIFVFQG